LGRRGENLACKLTFYSLNPHQANSPQPQEDRSVQHHRRGNGSRHGPGRLLPFLQGRERPLQHHTRERLLPRGRAPRAPLHRPDHRHPHRRRALPQELRRDGRHRDPQRGQHRRVHRGRHRVPSQRREDLGRHHGQLRQPDRPHGAAARGPPRARLGPAELDRDAPRLQGPGRTPQGQSDAGGLPRQHHHRARQAGGGEPAPRPRARALVGVRLQRRRPPRLQLRAVQLPGRRAQVAHQLHRERSRRLRRLARGGPGDRQPPGDEAAQGERREAERQAHAARQPARRVAGRLPVRLELVRGPPRRPGRLRRPAAQP